MNNRFKYILIIFHLATLGCKEEPEKIELNNEKVIPDKIEGLTLLTEDWAQDSTTYWSRDADSTYHQLKPSDTLSMADYIVAKAYQLRLGTNLTLKKLIEIDPSTKNKISETDVYIRRYNPNIEARLGLTYNYNTKEFNADFLDSTGTREKHQANRMKADSILNYAEKEDLYLCGTAYNSILWEDVPFLPVPKEIAKDSALSIIDVWIKK